MWWSPVSVFTVQLTLIGAANLANDSGHHVSLSFNFDVHRRLGSSPFGARPRRTKTFLSRIVDPLGLMNRG